MLFKDIKIGTKFFDTYSGEFYIKVSDNMATDAGDMLDEFDGEEEMIVDNQ